MSFTKKLERQFVKRKHVCVGLDTDPAEISEEVEAILRREFRLPPFGAIGPLMLAFNKAIINATKNIAACYKLNRAFYDAQGFQGAYALHATAEYLREAALDVPWILDAKYGDIGNTARKYARHAFEFLQADAVTVNPWGGKADGIDAFLEYGDRGVFVWCRGSNKGSSEFQDLPVSRPYSAFPYKVSTEVASNVWRRWNEQGNCGLVVGAAHPEEFRIIRFFAENVLILVPGIGAQGGNLRESVKAAIYTNHKTGEKSLPALFNSSRGIIYSSKGADFAKAARMKVLAMNKVIRGILKEDGI